LERQHLPILVESVQEAGSVGKKKKIHGHGCIVILYDTQLFTEIFLAPVCPRIALTSRRLFRQTACMAAEIDDNLPSNSSSAN
jgi:hypothetical protein